ncbi:hypothetical protein WJX73_000956 [Symbiochloris irregularis]|uniref:Nitroreductase domain-containing protein n=1 Tax=Symbiochloris irregularis TaxID=706552 RepID=A0AAW1P884_9CHLO
MTFIYAAWTTFRPIPKVVNGTLPASSKPAVVPSALQADQVSQLLAKRRSIFPKDFSGAHVPREQVETILEAANWAPTHNRTEPWRFTVLGRKAQEDMVDLTLKALPGKLNPEWEETCAVAAAVQNIYIMTSALGLGGYWSSWTAEARDTPEFKELLGLEEQDKCLGFFLLGVPKQGVVEGYRSSRGALSDKVAWK